MLRVLCAFLAALFVVPVVACGDGEAVDSPDRVSQSQSEGLQQPADSEPVRVLVAEGCDKVAVGSYDGLACSRVETPDVVACGKGEDVEIVKLPCASPIAKPRAPQTDTYRVNVICDLDKAIEAGKYDRVDNDITQANFPQACKAGDVEVILVAIDRAMTGEEVVAELGKKGLRPATLAQLLSLGAAQPDLQRQFYIVALGSQWCKPVGHRGVPVIGRSGSGRFLGLDWGGPIDWCRTSYRFPAVRK